MSHAAQEAANGAPRELFVFARGMEVWRYYGGDAEVVRNGHTYAPAAIVRTSGLEPAQRSGRGEVELTLPVALPIAQAILATTATQGRVVCTIQRLHATDGALPELITVYTGEVHHARIEDATLRLTLRSILASLDRPALRVLFQRSCSNVFGDHLCGVNLADHRETVTVTAVSGATVTVQAAGALTVGDYAGGILAWGAERYAIERHAAADAGADHAALTLFPPPAAAIVGAAVTITAGCDKTRATCRDRFNNLDRYMGFDRMPASNPFRHGF